MLTLICAVVLIILGILLIVLPMEKFKESIQLACAISGCVLLLTGLVFPFIVLSSGVFDGEPVEQTTTKPIYNLADSKYYVGQSKRYFTYAVMRELGKHIEDLPANVCYIIDETDPEQPYLETHYKTYADRNKMWSFQNDEPFEYRYVFVIPKGSVKNDFHIDLE